MKLQTMLLPTGQFVLIISEAPGQPEAYKSGLKGIRDEIGAAAVLVFDHPVEVEDAQPKLPDLLATWGPTPPDEPWQPSVGDRVLCRGHSTFGTYVEGLSGTVTVDEGESVEIRLTQPIDHTVIVHVPKSQVEPLPADLRG